jgi:sugar lactone lactonase YvrE
MMQHGFAIDLATVRPFGRDLHRPECVVACHDGSVFVPDWRGGVTRMRPDGAQDSLLPPGLEWLRPNSLTLEPGGSMVLAHLDDHAGGVFRLWSDGAHEPVLTEFDGRPLPPTNFVLADGEDLWVTVSTRTVPRYPARRPNCRDGYVLRLRRGRAELVADHLGFTNEVRIDPERRYLYVVETFARRISRFPLSDSGLGPQEVFAELGAGHYPDGIAFDVEGALWVTSIFSNRLLRITPDRHVHLVLDDADPAFVAGIDGDYASGRLAQAGHVDVPPRTLGNVSSLAFGGPDLSTLYLGCLVKSEINVTASPVAGFPMPHWKIEVPAFSGTS